MSTHIAHTHIEQMQLQGRRRVDGVGRPKFDFHTGRTGPEASQRASVLGVGILFKARQLRAHHGPCLEGDGEPLKETLSAIAHDGRGRASLYRPPSAARGARCVDFCGGGAAAESIARLCDKEEDEGVLATLKSAARQRRRKSRQTVDLVLWEEVTSTSRPLSRARPSRARSSMRRAGRPSLRRSARWPDGLS